MVKVVYRLYYKLAWIVENFFFHFKWPSDLVVLEWARYDIHGKSPQLMASL